MTLLETAKQALEYDPNTGDFTWSSDAAPKVAGKKASSIDSKGYLQVKINKKQYLLHRLAWAFTYGDFPKLHIDHINGNPKDNRICNLREVTRSINMQNQRKAMCDSKSGLLGASPHNKGWRSQITSKGKKIYLGTFETALEAHTAYVKAKRILHEGSTL